MASIAAQLAKDRCSALGIGTNKNPVKYLNQDYEELLAQCLASGKLFEDPTFPAAQASLGFNHLGPKSKQVQGIVWKRPAEIKEKPQFIIEGANRADVRQGSLGDCWFLCSIASLTLNEECLNRVVPGDQSFDNNYAGIFHFKFWQYGQWVDVVVDDRLPTKEGKLHFVRSTAACEFWSALLEKAYAKLNGSYEALKGGLPLEALEDFTGGVGELYHFEKATNNLFQIICKALKAKSLVTCSSKSDSGSGEIVVSTNVVKNHAYSLIGAEEVSYRGDTVQLVRVRNPWGYKEWNGAWSDNAPEWNEVDPEVKAQLHLLCDDGETWMPFSSFLVEFYRVEVCHLNLDNVCCNDIHKWCLTEYNGKWTSGVNAGGCKSNLTFWTNPQFWVNLEDPDEDCKEESGEPHCTVLVSLMQKERRRKKPQGQNLLKIGYYIYKVPKQGLTDLQLGKDFLTKNKEAARVDIYKDHREVSNRFLLPVGNYVIIPTTYSPCEEADFFLRVFSERNSNGLETGNVVEENIYEPLSNSAPEVEPQNGCEESDEEQREEFDVEDLSRALKKKLSKYTDIKSDGFGLRTCREWINLMDVDNTGTLSAEEYKTLCMKLDHYIKIFLEVDANHSGSIDAHEMRNALKTAGFNLNTRIQEIIVQRYVSRELSINFEDFIACLIRLETLFKMFKILDTDKGGRISLSLSEWLCAALI
ncbi:calpain-8-like [Rana temporaria]|uniref:calpain-8-like n=1 Tax=Rana temporaria TaxID=8407 RepID=UPI001AADD57C|nr:calpain-8-like [Rana temporaria]